MTSGMDRVGGPGGMKIPQDQTGVHGAKSQKGEMGPTKVTTDLKGHVAKGAEKTVSRWEAFKTSCRQLAHDFKILLNHFLGRYPNYAKQTDKNRKDLDTCKKVLEEFKKDTDSFNPKMHTTESLNDLKGSLQKLTTSFLLIQYLTKDPKLNKELEHALAEAKKIEDKINASKDGVVPDVEVAETHATHVKPVTVHAQEKEPTPHAEPTTTAHQEVVPEKHVEHEHIAKKHTEEFKSGSKDDFGEVKANKWRFKEERFSKLDTDEDYVTLEGREDRGAEASPEFLESIHKARAKQVKEAGKKEVDELFEGLEAGAKAADAEGKGVKGHLKAAGEFVRGAYTKVTSSFRKPESHEVATPMTARHREAYEKAAEKKAKAYEAKQEALRAENYAEREKLQHRKDMHDPKVRAEVDDTLEVVDTFAEKHVAKAKMGPHERTDKEKQTAFEKKHPQSKAYVNRGLDDAADLVEPDVKAVYGKKETHAKGHKVSKEEPGPRFELDAKHQAKTDKMLKKAADPNAWKAKEEALLKERYEEVETIKPGLHKPTVKDKQQGSEYLTELKSHAKTHVEKVKQVPQDFTPKERYKAEVMAKLKELMHAALTTPRADGKSLTDSLGQVKGEASDDNYDLQSFQSKLERGESLTKHEMDDFVRLITKGFTQKAGVLLGRREQPLPGKIKALMHGLETLRQTGTAAYKKKLEQQSAQGSVSAARKEARAAAKAGEEEAEYAEAIFPKAEADKAYAEYKAKVAETNAKAEELQLEVNAKFGQLFEAVDTTVRSDGTTVDDALGQYLGPFSKENRQLTAIRQKVEDGKEITAEDIDAAIKLITKGLTQRVGIVGANVPGVGTKGEVPMPLQVLMNVLSDYKEKL